MCSNCSLLLGRATPTFQCDPLSKSRVLIGTLVHEDAHLRFVLVGDPVVIVHTDIPLLLDLASNDAAPL